QRPVITKELAFPTQEEANKIIENQQKEEESQRIAQEKWTGKVAALSILPFGRKFTNALTSNISQSGQSFIQTVKTGVSNIAGAVKRGALNAEVWALSTALAFLPSSQAVRRIEELQEAPETIESPIVGQRRRAGTSTDVQDEWITEQGIQTDLNIPAETRTLGSEAFTETAATPVVQSPAVLPESAQITALGGDMKLIDAEKGIYAKTVTLQAVLENSDGTFNVNERHAVTMQISGTRKDIGRFEDHVKTYIPFINVDNNMIFLKPGAKPKRDASLLVRAVNGVSFQDIRQAIKDGVTPPVISTAVNNVGRWSNAIYASGVLTGFHILFIGGNMEAVRNALNLSAFEVALFAVVSFAFAALSNPPIAAKLKTTFGKKATMFAGLAALAAGGAMSVYFGLGHFAPMGSRAFQYGGLLASNFVASTGVFLLDNTLSQYLSNFTGDAALRQQKTGILQKFMAGGVVLTSYISSPLSRYGFDTTLGVPLLAIGGAAVGAAFLLSSGIPNFKHSGFFGQPDPEKKNISLAEQWKFLRTDPQGAAGRILTSSTLMNGAEVGFMVATPMLIAPFIGSGNVGTASVFYSAIPFILGRLTTGWAVKTFGVNGSRLFGITVALGGILGGLSFAADNAAIGIIGSIGLLEYGISSFFSANRVGFSRDAAREPKMVALVNDSLIGAALFPLLFTAGRDFATNSGMSLMDASRLFFFYAPVPLFAVTAGLLFSKTPWLKEFLKGPGKIWDSVKRAGFFNKNSGGITGGTDGTLLFSLIPIVNKKVTKSMTLPVDVADENGNPTGTTVNLPVEVSSSSKDMEKIVDILKKVDKIVLTPDGLSYIKDNKITGDLALTPSDGTTHHEAAQKIQSGAEVAPVKTNGAPSINYTSFLYTALTVVGFETIMQPLIGVIQQQMHLTPFETSLITVFSFIPVAVMPFISGALSNIWGKKVVVNLGLASMLAGGLLADYAGFGHFAAWQDTHKQLMVILSSALLVSMGADSIYNASHLLLSSFTGHSKPRENKIYKLQFARAAGIFLNYFTPGIFAVLPFVKDPTAAVPYMLVPAAAGALLWLNGFTKMPNFKSHPSAQEKSFFADLKDKAASFMKDKAAKKLVGSLGLINAVEFALGSAGPMIFEHFYPGMGAWFMNVLTYPIPFVAGRATAKMFINKFGQNGALLAAGSLLAAGVGLGVLAPVHPTYLYLGAALALAEYAISSIFGISFINGSKDVKRQDYLNPFLIFSNFGCALGPLFFSKIATELSAHFTAAGGYANPEFSGLYWGMLVAPIPMTLAAVALLNYKGGFGDIFKNLFKKKETPAGGAVAFAGGPGVPVAAPYDEIAGGGGRIN
ncbi:MAG: hypothetical protein FWF35_05680, partial [Elusimicrobia bacterium]|nr:hypothetical protein [Elusimicrobiota bacterium]